MSNIVQLSLDFNVGEFAADINPVAVKGQNGLLLIDCGFTGFLPRLEQAMAKEAISMDDVKKLLITHHDTDHMGALKAIIEKYPDIDVLCSPEQAPYITGEEKPLRLTLFEQKNETLTDETERKALEDEMQGLREVQTIDSVTVIADGTVLTDCGVKLIEVSGHMPGHICAYIEREKTLIAGDALISSDGRLQRPDRRFTLDMDTALKSLEKLLDYDIDTVICYHGGIVTEQVRESLLSIIRGE